MKILRFCPFADGKTKIPIFQASIHVKSWIFENVVLHQLKPYIEWISNCSIITDITRLCFDKSFLKILLLQIVLTDLFPK